MQDYLPLEFLVCPQNHTRLRLAESALIERLNGAVAAGEVSSAAGRRIEKTIEEGLVREDGRLLYPIVDEIPILLADEAIAVDQPECFKK